MEKKIKFSDKSTVQKIVYLTVIAILCVSAIVIGIVASNSRKQTNTDDVPPTSDENGNTDNEGNGNTTPPAGNDENKPTGDANTKPTLAFVSPVVGTVIKSHSSTVPVFSETLEEWRIHTGVDISTDEGANVVAAEGGEITAVFTDPMLGVTVELTHSETHKSYYSNLDKTTVAVSVGDKVSKGDLLGTVGDTSVSEMAEEPHLHFEMKVNGVSVNPLDYISEESKEASLGIVA